MASQKPPPPFERWTNEDEQRLVALQSDVISIGDTVFGRQVALKKRELEVAACHFSREERDAMRQRLDAMDASEANEPSQND